VTITRESGDPETHTFPPPGVTCRETDQDLLTVVPVRWRPVPGHGSETTRCAGQADILTVRDGFGFKDFLLGADLTGVLYPWRCPSHEALYLAAKLTRACRSYSTARSVAPRATAP
jgi:hypothetical protein